MWPIVNPEAQDELLKFQDHQLDFATSPEYAKLASGGWGSGKTFAGLAYIAIAAFLSPPNSVGVAVLPSYPMLSEWLDQFFLPAFQKVIRAHFVGKRCIVLPDNRKLYYRSGSEPKRIQMTNAAYVYMDEPHLMDPQIFFHGVGRARKKGARIQFGLTSLPKIGWLSKEFKDKQTADRRCMYFETKQNKHLNPEYERQLRLACPATMIDCYLRGRFIAAGGSVYSEFSEQHIIPWEYKTQVQSAYGQLLHTEIGIVIDWSPRRPHVLWIHRIPPGIRLSGGKVTERPISIVVDELFPDGQYQDVTVKRLCEMIKKRVSYHKHQRYPIAWAIVDPAGKAIQSTSGESEIIQAKKFLGIPILYEHGKRIRVGIEHVKLALNPSAGHPYLYFAESLRDNRDGHSEENLQRSILNAMGGYSYPEPKDGKLPDEPHHDDVFSHACDCARYYVEYYEPQDRLSVDVWRAA